MCRFHHFGLGSFECSSASAEPRERHVQQANKNAPRIIFIDRSNGSAAIAAPARGGNDDCEQTLTTAVEMDGFEANEGIILIAANQPRTCSTRRCCAGPLRPPGRGAERTSWPRADPQGPCAQGSLAPDVTPNRRPRTPGFSGADLMNLCQRAPDAGPAQQAHVTQ